MLVLPQEYQLILLFLVYKFHILHIIYQLVLVCSRRFILKFIYSFSCIMGNNSNCFISKKISKFTHLYIWVSSNSFITYNKNSVSVFNPILYLSLTFVCNKSLIGGLGLWDNNADTSLVSPLYLFWLFDSWPCTCSDNFLFIFLVVHLTL